jgi:hypothetical protein
MKRGKMTSTFLIAMRILYIKDHFTHERHGRVVTVKPLGALHIHSKAIRILPWIFTI